MGMNLAGHVTRIFIDECHELLTHHPERQDAFVEFAKSSSKRDVQCIWLSGTSPPHLYKSFCKITFSTGDTHIIRTSTDRPNLGYQVLSVDRNKDKTTSWDALLRLTAALKETLVADERIIVFFLDTS